MLEAKASARNVPVYQPALGGRDGLLCDFNENLVGCSPRVLERLRSLTALDLARYPDRQSGERLAARSLGVAGEQVLLTNGVDEAVHLLCESFLAPGDEAIVVVPTFGMYEVYAAAAGATVVTIPAAADFSFPLTKVLEQISARTRFVVLASPNNPTGAVIARQDLLAVAASAPNAAVLVDEAYYEFHGESVVDAIADYENLFVARTFSKAYGLAGLRLGVVVGNAASIAQVRRFASPYNVNAAALACLPAALDDAYVAAYVAQVCAGRLRLTQALEALGLRVWPSAANFVLARIGDAIAEFVAAMAREGILVRNRDSDPACAGCVRITVGPPEVVDRVIAAARTVLGRREQVIL